MNTTNNTLNFSDFHIGKLIKAEVVRQGRSSAWLAKNVHCSVENIYKIYHQQWIMMPLLMKISFALNFDFFKLCSDYFDAHRENVL